MVRIIFQDLAPRLCEKLIFQDLETPPSFLIVHELNIRPSIERKKYDTPR